MAFSTIGTRSIANTLTTARGWLCRQIALSLILLAWVSTALGQSKPILIQPQIQFQRMDGFGVSGSNGCAREIDNLPSAERLKLFDLLFSPKEAGLNILRNEIGWTGQRVGITARLRLTGLTFSFRDDDRETSQFSLLRQAKKRQEILLNSCIWSPPLSWKSNQAVDGSGSLLPGRFGDLAEYLVGYVEYYARLRGQPVHVLSLQNRPDRKTAPVGCHYGAQQLKELVKIVGLSFKRKRIRTRLMVPEVGWNEAAPFLQAVSTDPEIQPFLSHVGVQSSVDHSNPTDVVSRISRQHNLKLWQTQFTTRAGGEDEMDEALELARAIIDDLVRGCRAWLYGPVFATEIQPGQLGLLERKVAGFRAPKRFWALTQFSRFIPRDAVRVFAAGGSTPVVAFRSPEYNQLVVVLVNSGEEPLHEEIELRGFTLERIGVFRTSAEENNQAARLTLMSGPIQKLTLAPRSINTLRASLRRVSSNRSRD